MGQSASAQPSLLARGWISKVAGENEEDTKQNLYIKVMQYNLLADGLAQTGGFEFATAEQLSWEYRWRLHCEEIKACDADILGVEELNHPESLASLLPTHTMMYVPKMDSAALKVANAPPDGVALLVRRNMFEVLNVDIVYYTEPPNSKACVGEECLLSNQNAIVCVLRDRRVAGGVLVVAVTHLKAKGGEENEAKRRHQVGELLDKVAALKQHAETTHKCRVRALILGDFNSPPSDSVYEKIRTNSVVRLRSLYNTSPIVAEHESSQHQTSSSSLSCSDYSKHEPPYTTMKYRAGVGLKRHTIDYIWASDNVLEKQATDEGKGKLLAQGEGGEEAPRLLLDATWSIPTEAEVGEHGLPSASYPSDHLALAARLQWLR